MNQLSEGIPHLWYVGANNLSGVAMVAGKALSICVRFMQFEQTGALFKEAGLAPDLNLPLAKSAVGSRLS